MILWKFAFRNILRNKRRSLATALAITSGFIGLLLLGGYIARAQKGLKASAIYINLKGHLSIHKKEGIENFLISPKKFLISKDELDEIDKVLSKYKNQIDFYGPFITGNGLLSYNEKSSPVMITSFNPEVYYKALHHEFVNKWAKDWILNKDFNYLDWNMEDISVTPSLAEHINKIEFWKNPSSSRDVQIVAKSFETDLNAVSANLKTIHSTGVVFLEHTSLYIPIKLFQDLFYTDGAQYISIFLKNENDTASLLTDLKKDFEAANLKLDIFPFYSEKISAFYVGTMSFLYVMGGFFIFLICGAVILTIVNSLTMGILERSKELGTLRALGFETQTIVSIFLRESILLTALCIVVGSLCAKLIERLIFISNIRFAPPGVQGDIQFMLSLDLWIVITILISFSLLTVVTSKIVSDRLLNKKIINLLQETSS